MDANDGLNALAKGGMQIMQNSGVQNSIQNLGKTVIQGGVSVCGATGAAVIGHGTVAGISSAAATAGSAISSAATAVGSAVASAAASPIVIGCAVVGVGILAIVGISKLFK